MPEYIQYDAQGKIIQKWYSADPSIVVGLSNILEIPRDLFNSLTKYYKVDNGIVREMTQTEKDAFDQEELQAQIEAENKRILDLESKIQDTALSGITLSKIDNAIDNIGSLADAKVFLKKLCRYIIKFIVRRK
jgi:hypothetical protein